MEPLKGSAALQRVSALACATPERALIVLGEPGIGKTHLLEAAQQAVSISAELVRVNPSEAAFALSGISSVLGALSSERMIDFGGRFELRSYEPGTMFSAAHDLLSLLQGFALPPTLLLIDDIDMMDPESQMLLAVMATRLAGTNIRIVATATALGHGSSLTSLPTVRLAPLPLADLVTVARRLTPDADDATLRVVAEYSGGNPRVLEEYLHLLEPEQLRGSVWLMLPPRWNHALEAVAVPLLGTLSPDDKDVLDIVALSPLCHGRVLEEHGVETADRVEDLVDAGLLRRRGPYLAFRDQRVRSYIHWSHGSRARRERHAALVEAAHKCGGPHLAAWHRSFASHGRHGVDDLLEAAIWLVDQGEVEAAVEYAERALRTSTDEKHHVPRIIDLCSRLLLHGHVVLAERYSTHIRTDAVSGEQAMQLASFALAAQMFTARRLADDDVSALVALHADADPEGSARILTMAAGFRAERWEVDDARHLLVPLKRLEQRIGPHALERLHLVEDILDAIEGRPTDAADPADSPVDLERRPPSVLLMQGRLLTYRERYDDARRLLNVVLNYPETVDRLWAELARYALIDNEIAAGEFRRARAAIDAWAGDSPWVGRSSSTHLFLLAWYSYSLGRLDDAISLTDQCIEQAWLEGSPATRARALALRGTMALLTDDPDAAVVHFRQVNGFAGRFRNPALLRHTADYLEACSLTHRKREADGVLTALEKRLTAHRGRWGDLAQARGRAILAPDSTALGLFSDAIESFGKRESPYERGRTLLCLAARQDALGRTHDARHTRTAALSAFDSAGAVGWADRGGRSASEPEQSVTGLLTDEEWAIVRRVQQGERNREIADALYLSVRTVELRLTHIYRTLGVRSRSHLVAAMSRLPESHRG